MQQINHILGMEEPAGRAGCASSMENLSHCMRFAHPYPGFWATTSSTQALWRVASASSIILQG